MGILSGWVITVAGVVVLINVCEILMPEGEMNKYIKGILAIVCMFVLVAPLPKLLNQSFDISDILFGDSADVNLDYSFLDYVNRSKADALQSDWKKKTDEAQLPGFEFAIQPKSNSTTFVIEAVVVQCSEQNRAKAEQAIALICEQYELSRAIFQIHVDSA